MGASLTDAPHPWSTHHDRPRHSEHPTIPQPRRPRRVRRAPTDPTISFDVLLNGRPCADLTVLEDDTLTLRYESAWTNREEASDDPEAFPLSPNLPLTARSAGPGVEAFFENLLPEGAARAALARRLHVDPRQTVGLVYGIRLDFAGAVGLRVKPRGGAGKASDSSEPAELSEPDDEPAQAFRPIGDDELLLRLRDPARHPMWLWDGMEGSDGSEGFWPVTVAGVQAKLTVRKRDGRWGFPLEVDRAMTHILKFSRPDMLTLELNEFLTMRLAEKSGLPTAVVKLVEVGGSDGAETFRILEVERFDRIDRIDRSLEPDGRILRRHVVDACQALGKSVFRKYERSFGDGRDVRDARIGVSWPMVTDLADIAAVRAAFTEALWEGFVFNQIVRNSDAHGKNWSFFVGPEGLTLTPLYDLVNVAVMRDLYLPQLDTALAMAVGDEFLWEAVRPADWVASADDCGLPLWQLAAIMERMAGRVRAALADFSDVLVESRIRPEEAAFVGAWRRSVEEGLRKMDAWRAGVEQAI